MKPKHAAARIAGLEARVAKLEADKRALEHRLSLRPKSKLIGTTRTPIHVLHSRILDRLRSDT